MRMKADHDIHLHSQLSRCSRDPLQTAEALMAHARETGLLQLCITDHFWDAPVPGASDWYKGQDLAHLSSILPLPQEEGVQFFFGCEAEMDKHFRLGILRESFDAFDFVIIALTHLHRPGFTIPEEMNTAEARAAYLVERFERLFAMDLPFEKIGLAHITTPLLWREVPEGHLQVLERITDAQWERIFSAAAQKGCGVELNLKALKKDERVLHPYRIARDMGCRFYLGSDAHHPADLVGNRQAFEMYIEELKLAEEMRFRIAP